jgi:serine/threonine protein kinase
MKAALQAADRLRSQDPASQPARRAESTSSASGAGPGRSSDVGHCAYGVVLRHCGRSHRGRSHGLCVRSLATVYVRLALDPWNSRRDGDWNPHSRASLMESETEPDADSLIGTVIDGKYRVDRLLGVGGMGAVYRVHHQGLRREFALKVLRPELTSHKEVAARFDREAQSAASLDHPNCLHVTDFGTTERGLKYMVMQLLSGHELSEELASGPLAPERAVSLMLQIARGLAHAHEHGIVHRDIKPENVFVTTDHDDRELLKLVDFGIAKVLEGELAEASPKLTRVGMIFGTPRYMSPEQASGGDIDHRSDLYSVGVVFYEMLAGTVPFDSEDLVRVLRQQIIDPPPPLPEHVPIELRAIVERLLAKHRGDRFESAMALVRQLEVWQAGSSRPSASLEAAASSSSASVSSGPAVTSVPVTGPGASATDIFTALGRGTGGADLARSLPTLLPTAPPPKPFLARVPPRTILGAAVGGALALTITCAWMLGGDELPELDPVAVGAIDDAIVANRLDEAEGLLEPLEKEHPEHPHLRWRRARMLAKDPASRGAALVAYGTAAQAAPALLEEPAFFAELDRLLRDPKLQTAAVEVAIERLGHTGHAFLLERLNDLAAPLPWAERKQAATAVATHEECALLLDARRQIAQDLLQAAETDDTCAVFGAALGKMKADPDEVYLQPAHDAKLPRSCKEHKALQAEVREALVERHGPPKNAKSSGRCRGVRGIFRSGC